MRIINTTKTDLGLGPEVYIPAGGETDLPDDAVDAFAASDVVKAYFADGWLVAVDRKGPDKHDRAEIISGAILALGEDGFSASGKPKVSAINEAMPGADPVTASERDAIWAEMQGDTYE